MNNEETNQRPEKETKLSPTRLISYPKQKIPRYLKEMIDVNNTMQSAAECMYALTSSVVSEELKKY